MWAIAEATVDDALAPLSAARARGVHRIDGQGEGPLQSLAGGVAMSRRGQTWLRLALLVAVPLVAVAGGRFWWLSGGRYVSTDNAYVKAHIVQIAPEVSGQVRRVPVHDHASVAAGETLLTIESRPFRLALDSAEAELDAARTQVETLRAHLARGGERAGRRRGARRLLPAPVRSARRSWRSRAWPRRPSATNRRTTRARPPTGSPRCARSCSAC